MSGLPQDKLHVYKRGDWKGVSEVSCETSTDCQIEWRSRSRVAGVGWIWRLQWKWRGRYGEIL